MARVSCGVPYIAADCDGLETGYADQVTTDKSQPGD